MKQVGDWLKSEYGEGGVYIANRASRLFYEALSSIDKKGTGVILPAITCHALAQATVLAGYIPIFADVNLNDFNISRETVFKAIKNTNLEVSVVVAVHSLGNICEVEGISELCKKSGIIMIEDICQLVGSGLEGKFGDIVLSSFGYSKPIEIGAGGAMLVRDERLNIKFQNRPWPFTNFRANPGDDLRFRHKYYSIRIEESKSRINRGNVAELTEPFREFILDGVNLPKWNAFDDALEALSQNNEYRKKNSAYFRENLQPIDGIEVIANSNSSIPWRFSFLLKNGELQKELTEKLRKKIQHASNWYPNLSADFKFTNQPALENSIKIEKSVINLWVDQTATREYLESAVDVVKEFFK